MVNARVRLRPTRSPMCPKSSPPSGRATKPTANVAKASMVPTAPFASGKNSFPKTRLAAVL